MSDRLYINIRPRASGKTSQILKSWFQYTQAGNEDVCIICAKYDYEKHLVRQFMNNYYFIGDENLEIYRKMLDRSVMSISSLIHNKDKLRVRKWNNFLIDEYLFFSVQEKFAVFEIFHTLGLDSIFEIYTTADRIYKSNKIEFVRQAIRLWRICNVFPFDFKELRHFISEDEFWELRHNLICHPEANIDCHFEDMRAKMPPENFRVSLGEFRE